MHMRERKRCEGIPVGLSKVSTPQLSSDWEIHEVFWAYFCIHLVKLPDLLEQEFFSFLVDSPCLQDAEAANCVGRMTDCEICDALKQINFNKSLGLDGLSYKVYMRLLYMFVPILTDELNQRRANILMGGRRIF